MNYLLLFILSILWAAWYEIRETRSDRNRYHECMDIAYSYSAKHLAECQRLRAELDECKGVVR